MIGKILIGGAIAGLIIRINWSAIDKFFESIQALQQPNQLIELPPSRLELPLATPVQVSDETYQMIRDLLNPKMLEAGPTLPVGNSSAFGFKEYPSPANAALVEKVRIPLRFYYAAVEVAARPPPS